MCLLDVKGGMEGQVQLCMLSPLIFRLMHGLKEFGIVLPFILRSLDMYKQ